MDAQPQSAEAQRKLAWLLATSPAKSRRNAAEALEHARRAVQLTAGNDPDALDALAAAYAEAGRFPDALATAHKALDLAEKQGKAELAEGLRTRIALYECGEPFRGALPDVSGIQLEELQDLLKAPPPAVTPVSRSAR